MKNFKDYTSLNEASMDTYFKRLQEREETLSNLIHGMRKGGVLRNGIVKELGTGYNKDFDKIIEHLHEAKGVLDDIIMDAGLDLGY
jgi:glutathionyl-hydroquinone reductase